MRCFPCFSSLASLALATTGTLMAADWSDTSLSWRYGVNYREPYNDENIKKNIIGFTHASGYKFGSNFVNLDVLISDQNDPARAAGGAAQEGATEFYLIYRHTLDFGKITATDLSTGPFRGFGFDGGFDLNLKSDAGYGSKKRMLVLGPKAMVAVPGFWDVGVVALMESNQPDGVTERYHYKTHPAIMTAWGIPFSLGQVALHWGGYANFIASKGDDEFGAKTSPETHLDTQVMADAATLFGATPSGLRVGAAVEYWRNKFGNAPDVVGSHAFTPMVRAEYHF